MYNDPSGEFIFLALAGWLGSKLLASAVIGAFVGLASYSVGVAITGQKWSLGGALKATFFGAVSGAATFGIGEIFSSCSGSLTVFEHLAKSLGDFGAMLVQGGVHAVSQGVMSLMQGDSFVSGAAGGFFGSLGASAWGTAVGGKFAGSAVGTIAFGALSGGVGAELTGGNFWQGAVTGGIVAGLNHVASRIETQTDYADGGGSGGIANDNNGNVLNWFSESDGALYKAAQYDPGVPEGTVRIYAHGEPRGILSPDGWILTPDKFDQVLMKRSPTWRNYRENGGTIKIELMSCNTGKGNNSFASRISQAFRFSSVMAPNNYYVAYRHKITGAFLGSGVAGQYNLINPGRWNYFVNGQNLTSIFNRR